MSVWHVLRYAWRHSVRPAHSGAQVIITRIDLAGLRGHVFNPFPSLDGTWAVLITDDYDPERWPAYDSGFQDLYRWEFVLAAHGVTREQAA